MEDREKSKATKPENIVELTPDMEVTDESQVEVIDLTDIVDGPDEIPAFASPVSETPAEAKRPVSRPPTGSIYSSVIEQEVEAAFDFVQSPIQVTAPETPPPANHVGLMDKLSDIPRMVDDALDVSGAPDTRDDDTDDGLAQPADLEAVDTASRRSSS